MACHVSFSMLPRLQFIGIVQQINRDHTPSAILWLHFFFHPQPSTLFQHHIHMHLCCPVAVAFLILQCFSEVLTLLHYHFTTASSLHTLSIPLTLSNAHQLLLCSAIASSLLRRLVTTLSSIVSSPMSRRYPITVLLLSYNLSVITW